MIEVVFSSHASAPPHVHGYEFLVRQGVRALASHRARKVLEAEGLEGAPQSQRRHERGPRPGTPQSGRLRRRLRRPQKSFWPHFHVGVLAEPARRLRLLSEGDAVRDPLEPSLDLGYDPLLVIAPCVTVVEFPELSFPGATPSWVLLCARAPRRLGGHARSRSEELSRLCLWCPRAPQPESELALGPGGASPHLIERDGRGPELRLRLAHAHLGEDQLTVRRRHALCQPLEAHMPDIHAHGSRAFVRRAPPRRGALYGEDVARATCLHHRPAELVKPAEPPPSAQAAPGR